MAKDIPLFFYIIQTWLAYTHFDFMFCIWSKLSVIYLYWSPPLLETMHAWRAVSDDKLDIDVQPGLAF